jgi:putative NIF3 family GTP cyclohydrolase 1 type 2
MITGELREDNVRAAEESGLSLYAAGHYNSEKWGIRALGEHLREKFDLSVEFLDIPNPV